MKRLFLTFAAMLLVSVSTFAQSGETPLKGDVNEDGVVDVADINAVIAIMKNGGGIGGETKYYWYAGTTEPTASNISSIASESLTDKPTTWTAENPKSIAATNNTSASTPIYYCFPTDWNVIVLDEDKVSEVLLPDVSTFEAGGVQYTVQKTGRNISAGVTKPYYAVIPPEQTTDIFYFGTTQPTASNYTTLTPIYSSSPEVYGKTVNVSSGEYIYYLCPSSKALTTEQRKSAMLDGGGNIVKFSTDIDDTTISGYTIYKQFIDNTSTMKFNINY